MSLRHHAPPTVRPALRPPAPAQPSSLARAGTQSGGQSLDRGTQARMSARFGHDFSSVRIHTDSRAEESAQALGANAYALGSDIVFGAGKYLPGSSDTQRLLAHELTHVVQQAQHGPGDPSRMSDRADASEREADTLATQVMAGRNVSVNAAPGSVLARDEVGAGGEEEDKVEKNPLVKALSADPLGLSLGFGQETLSRSVKADAHVIEETRAADLARQKQFERMDFMDDHPGAVSRPQNLLNAEIDLEAAERAADFAKSGGAMVPELGAAKDAARLARPLKAVEGAGKWLAPVAGISAGQDLAHDLGKENWGHAALDAANLGAAGIGTADLMGVLGAGKFLPGLGQVLGTFGASFGIGTDWYHDHNTEIGKDSRDALGDIDRFMGGTPGHSKAVEWNDRMHESWDKGGVKNDLKAGGYLLDQAVMAAVGAGTGLAKAGVHQMRNDDEKGYGDADSTLSYLGAPSLSEMDERSAEFRHKGGAMNYAKGVGYKALETAGVVAGAVDGGVRTTGRTVEGVAKAGYHMAGDVASALYGDEMGASLMKEGELQMKRQKERDAVSPVGQAIDTFLIGNYLKASPEEKKAMPDAMAMEAVTKGLNPFGPAMPADKDHRR